MFCHTSQLKIEQISAYKFVAKFPEQRVKVCFAKFMEAFVQILLFAEVSQRSHGTVGRLVSRFGAFIQCRSKGNISGGARKCWRREPLGGSGGMLPQKNLKSRDLEMLFPAFSKSYL